MPILCEEVSAPKRSNNESCEHRFRYDESKVNQTIKEAKQHSAKWDRLVEDLRREGKVDNPETNPKVEMLLEKLKRGINLGLSVGGTVTKEREEYFKEIGKKLEVIDGVKLYEVSVVGIPSNAARIS